MSSLTAKLVRAYLRHGVTYLDTLAKLGLAPAKAGGVRPALAPGTRITGARLTMKKQDTVVFYVLEDYRVVAFRQAA